MSAQMRVFQHAQDLQDLKALSDLINNPAAITAAAETARKEAALTQDAIDKAKAAEAFIAKHAALSAELKQREDALAAAKAEHEQSHAKRLADHEKAVAAFNETATAETKRLTELAAELSAKETQQIATANRQIEERKNFDNDRNALAQEHKDAMDKVLIRENEAAKARANYEAATNKLKEDQLKLKQKAAKLKEQVSAFGDMGDN